MPSYTTTVTIIFSLWLKSHNLNCLVPTGRCPSVILWHITHHLLAPQEGWEPQPEKRTLPSLPWDPIHKVRWLNWEPGSNCTARGSVTSVTPSFPTSKSSESLLAALQWIPVSPLALLWANSEEELDLEQLRCSASFWARADALSWDCFTLRGMYQRKKKINPFKKLEI